MGLTPAEATVGGEASEELRRPRSAEFLDKDSLSDLPIDVLRNRINEVSQWARVSRVDLMVTLAGVAHEANRPLSVLAGELKLTESGLAHLISVSSRDTDEPLLLKFLEVCGAGMGTLERVHTQLAILREADRTQRRLGNERMRRERREREAQIAVRDREAAKTGRVAEAYAGNMAVFSTIAVEDAPGHNSKPDPLKAKTEEEFVDTMRRYRVWARNPSLREMAQACGQRVSHATFRNMLRASTVPKRFNMVEAFVMALNGTEDDRKVWASAWRHFTVPAPQAASAQDSQDASVLHLAHRKVSETDGYTPVASAVGDGVRPRLT